MTLTREQIEAPERIHIRPTHPYNDDLAWYVWSDGTAYIRADVAERQARIDAEAAVALVVERAAAEVGTIDPHTLEDREALMRRVVSAIRATASPSGVEELAKLRAERDGWMETARMAHNGEQTFLSWLRAAGEHMRAEGVTVCDDGVDSGEVLTAKVAECAALLKADRDRLAAQLAEAEARVKVLEEWRDVVSWLDNDEKTFFDWCAGGGDPDGEFSKIGLRRETPDGKTLYRAYKATGNWEAPALAAVTPPAAQEAKVATLYKQSETSV